MARGSLGGALISIVKGTMDSSLLALLPRHLTAPLKSLAIRSEARQVKGDDVPLQALIPTVHYDPRLVIESKGVIEKCRYLDIDVLLMGGKRSRTNFEVALDALAAALPNAKRITFPGLGHLAAENGGSPERIAMELRSFFKGGYDPSPVSSLNT